MAELLLLCLNDTAARGGADLFHLIVVPAVSFRGLLSLEVAGTEVSVSKAEYPSHSCCLLLSKYRSKLIQNEMIFLKNLNICACAGMHVCSVLNVCGEANRRCALTLCLVP